LGEFISISEFFSTFELYLGDRQGSNVNYREQDSN